MFIVYISYLHNIYTAKENCDDQFSIAHLRAGDDGDDLLGPGEGRVVGGDVCTGQVGVVQQEHQVLTRHLLFVLQAKKGKFIKTHVLHYSKVVICRGPSKMKITWKNIIILQALFYWI